MQGEKETSEILEDLQLKGDHFARLTVLEKKRQKDLDDAIDHIMKESDKHRARAKKAAIEVMNLHVLTPNPAFQRADGLNVGKEAEQMTKKVLAVTEVKLNKLLQRRAEIENKNRALKTEIDHFRMLRMQTDISHKSFEEILRDTKANIEAIMRDSTAVIEQRDHLVEMKESLERQNIEEQKQFEEEYEELGKYIKDQNNALENALLRDRKDELNVSGTSALAGTLSAAEEDEMAGRVGLLTSYVANEQTSLEQIKKTINEYEDMFAQLKKMTETTSLQEIISSYSQFEDEMFSLYSYIQTVNVETESVLEATCLLRDEVEKYKVDEIAAATERREAFNKLV